MMDFLHRTPFFRLTLPLLLGIVLSQVLYMPMIFLEGMSIVGFLMIGFSFLIKDIGLNYKFRWLFGSGIFLFLFALGVFLVSQCQRANEFEALNEKGVFQVELIASPLEKSKTYLCKVKLHGQYKNHHWHSVKGKAIIYIQKDSTSARLLFGDLLLVEGAFEAPSPPLNPDEFDYASYLRRQGIGATIYVPAGRWRFLVHDTSFSVFRLANMCRLRLLDVYRSFGIRGDEFAVLAGLTLGYTDALQPELKAGYSATGAMHILSVSGLHVGVVYAVLMFLLAWMDRFKRGKILRVLIILLFLWFYAFLTGLSAAVVRSSLMFSFVVIGTCFDKKSLIYNTVFMSMFFILLINPLYLFDVGFQLSYAAVLSIIFFQPMLLLLYNPKNKMLNLIWNLVLVSVAAQLGTTPFTLYYFQQFPNYFLLTNLIAIPLSTLVIYLAIGLFIINFIPYISTCVACLLKGSTWLMNTSIAYLYYLPGSVSIAPLTLLQSILLFGALMMFSTFYFKRRFIPLFIGLIFLCVLLGLDVFQTYSTMTSNRLLIFAGKRHTHINLIQHRRNQVITSDSVEAAKIGSNFWRKQKLENPCYLSSKQLKYICFGDKSYLLLDSIMFAKRTLGKPLMVDYLIIGNRMKPKMEWVFENIQPKNVIVDANISKWYTHHIDESCKMHNIPIYHIAYSGAFYVSKERY